MYKNIPKVMIKILQGSVLTQIVLCVRTAKCIFSVSQFHTVHICQKLWKLADSRQMYCKSCMPYCFWPTVYISIAYKDLHGRGVKAEAMSLWLQLIRHLPRPACPANLQHDIIASEDGHYREWVCSCIAV